jgi:hypothetical protein
LLKWLRGDGGTGSGGALSSGLSELEAFFSPGKRQQLENLQTLEMLADDDQSSAAPPRAVDLDANTAVISVSRAHPDTGATPEDAATSRS